MKSIRLSGMKQLPVDILLIIIKEIPDAKGFHSLSVSCRLFGRLCLKKEIQDSTKKRYLRTYCLDIRDLNLYMIQQQYPNGRKHGPCRPLADLDELCSSRHKRNVIERKMIPSSLEDLTSTVVEKDIISPLIRVKLFRKYSIRTINEMALYINGPGMES